MSQNQAPGWPDDETLVAFVDGQLSPDQAEKVERFLEENDEARRYVERLRISGAMAREVYDEAMRAPASDRLETLLRGEGESQGAATADASRRVVFRQVRKVSVSLASRYALPMAASVALLVGAIAGYVAGRQGPTGGGGSAFDVAIGPVGQGTSVATTLEQRLSGDQLPVAGGRSLMVIATFRDRAGRVCREIEVSASGAASAPVIGAVACRLADGVWYVEGAARMASSDPAYSPASGGDAPAIQGILSAIGAKKALTRSEEEALLKSGWK